MFCYKSWTSIFSYFLWPTHPQFIYIFFNHWLFWMAPNNHWSTNPKVALGRDNDVIMVSLFRCDLDVDVQLCDEFQGSSQFHLLFVWYRQKFEEILHWQHWKRMIRDERIRHFLLQSMFVNIIWRIPKPCEVIKLLLLQMHTIGEEILALNMLNLADDVTYINKESFSLQILQI